MAADRYLRFDVRRPPGGRPLLWPVRVWKVLYPTNRVLKLNLFQQAILGLASESPRVSQRLRGLSTGGFGLLDELQIIPILSLGRWDVADGLKESLMVEPGHPFEGSQFRRLHGFRGSTEHAGERHHIGTSGHASKTQ